MSSYPPPLAGNEYICSCTCTSERALEISCFDFVRVLFGWLLADEPETRLLVRFGREPLPSKAVGAAAAVTSRLSMKSLALVSRQGRYHEKCIMYHLVSCTRYHEEGGGRCCCCHFKVVDEVAGVGQSTRQTPRNLHHLSSRIMYQVS